MEIVEKQPFDIPAFAAISSVDARLYSCVANTSRDALIIACCFSSGQMEKLFVHRTPPDCFGLTGRVKYNFSLTD